VRAVLTDFGLAALAAAGEAGIGGTPGYIAPEVLAGRPFTIAGDLYALGRILELLLPGHPIARRCLAENPADRPKSAAQVLAALRPAPLLSRRPVIAALSFAGASGLFGAGAYYRSRRVEWAGRRRLVVNFIEGPAAAPYSQAMLSTALSQSPRFTVVAAEAVTAFQVRQKLKPASPVPPPNWIGLSRELRAAYVLNSSIASRPDGLVWSLELRDAAGGGTAGATEVVESGRSINWVRFADRAALAVRKLAGESGEALEASYVPLSQTTSRSIAAVEAYYEALRRTENSDVSGALVLLDQAISADPNFAMAYHEKARTFSRMSREISALEPSRRAYELRSRVTRYEQLWIEGMYFAFRADDGRALETFRKLVTLYPEDALAWRQFAQSAGYAGRTAEAVEAARTVVGLDSYNPISRSQLAMFLCESGREQEALNLTAVARLEGVNYNSLYWPESQALMGLRRYSESRVQLEMLGRNAAFARLARQRLAALLILEGNLSQAIASLQSDLAGDLETGEEQRPLRTRHWLAMLFNLSGDKGAALKQVRELLKAPVHPAGMEAFRHAGLQACAAGAIPEARMALANMEKVDAEWPASTHIHGTIAHLRGELAMALGQWNEAKAYLIEAAGLWRDPLSLFSLAGAYNGLEDYAAAAGTYSQMAQDRGYLLRRENPAYVPLMWLDQARAAARLSQFDESLRLYSIVTDHWGNSACPPGRAAVREMQSVRNRAKLQATTKGD
jgi:tetratricopeptide (TPR) repeat protein